MNQPDDSTDHGVLYNSVYSACYYLSFGLTFPTLLVARALPTTRAARRGFRDGATAAKGSVGHLRERTGHAVNAAAQRCGETVEGIQDRIAERKHQRQLAMLPARGSA
jgi:hypothetical protein